MKITQRAQSFFNHLTMEYALSKGWNLENSLEDFYLTKDLNVPAYSTTSGVTITELDIFKASSGEATQALEDFFSVVLNNTKLAEDQPLLVSMHSGSSDYLFVSEVRKMFNASIV